MFKIACLKLMVDAINHEQRLLGNYFEQLGSDYFPQLHACVAGRGRQLLHKHFEELIRAMRAKFTSKIA